MVDSELLPRSLREERFFRWRGGEVSRIEGLSDAVFALSLTLLVVALEVPKTGEGLVAVMGWMGYRTGKAVERAASDLAVKQ